MDFLTQVFNLGVFAPSTSTSTSRQSGSLTREEFITFANSCRTVYASSEFKNHVRENMSKGKNPDDEITTKQKAIFESMGINGDFGMRELQSIQSRFPQDVEVNTVFMMLVSAEDMLLDEMELPPEQFAAKLENARIAQEARQDIDNYMARLPVDQRPAFLKALQSASMRASAQIPKIENMTNEEFRRVTLEMSALTKRYLAEAGFVVQVQGQEGAIPAEAMFGSSVMSAEEQRKFFEVTSGQR